MEDYRDIGTKAPDYQPMAYWSSEREEQGLAEWLTGTYEAAQEEGELPPDQARDLAAVVGLPSAERGEAPVADEG